MAPAPNELIQSLHLYCSAQRGSPRTGTLIQTSGFPQLVAARDAWLLPATPATAGVHMTVRPLHDRLLVARIDEGEQTIGGIIVPDSAKEKPQRGTVVAVGLGKVREDGSRHQPDVKAGDTILFGKYSGQDIKVDGTEYLIMREDDVLAIVDSRGK
jgi:chaperonin GroES